jgi:trigger factor
MKDVEKFQAQLPDDIFRAQAERRVRLGLIVAELVRANELDPKPEQVKAHVEELASSYEHPEEVVRWYYSNPDRMTNVEALVLENNVTDFVLGKAQVTEKTLSFDDLMGQQG